MRVLKVVKAEVLYYPITNYRLELAVQRFPAFPPSLILQGVDDGRQAANRSAQLDALIATHQPAHELHL